jgi:predicted RNase H-like HicB family nuclease
VDTITECGEIFVIFKKWSPRSFILQPTASRFGVTIRLMDLTLTAVYREVPDSEGGGYVAYVEELPGAITQGETLEESRENLGDAIELRLDANRELTGKAQVGQKVIREKIQVTA